jgi:hypothetical protein
VRFRTGASVVAASALALLLAGCSLFAVHQTLHPYDASDGVSVTVGDVRIVNALVFTEDGQDGNFSAAAVNSGDDDVDLVLQYVSGGEKIDVEIEVPAGETVRLGSGEDGQVFLPEIDTPPGSLLRIYFQYGDRPGKQADIPVLDTALEEYDGLLPTPTPTPTPTGTSTPGEMPAPTETPAP